MKSDYRLLFTDSTCVIGDCSYPAIPLLIGPDDRVVTAASDWLRMLMVARGTPASSVRQYAYHLKYWWEYLRSSRTAWNEVEDATVVRWRDTELRDLDAGTVNGYISSVFRMYLWAERRAYVEGLIGEQDLATKAQYPLTVIVETDRRGHRRLISPLLKRTVAKPVLPTPTHEEITLIHQALVEIYDKNIHLMIRDALVLTWAEATGARRKEILSLKVAQIPTWNEIAELEESEKKSALTVVGKRNKKRTILAEAGLLIQTREYIEHERNKIATRWRRRLKSNYKVPKEIFLSTKTGQKIQEDSISQRFALAFRKAGVAGSLHRVRARFLTDLIFATLESEFEKLGTIPDAASVLLPVAEIAGHSSIPTLAPYFAMARKRLYRETKTEKAARLKEREVSSQRRLDMNLMRLRASETALNLFDALGSGKKSRIVTALKDVCKNHRIDVAKLCVQA